MRIRTVWTVALACALGFGLPAQEKPVAVPPDTAVAFAKALLPHASSKDPRVRLAVREALVILGRSVLPLVKEAQGGAEDPHVKAFLGRVAERIKKFGRLTSAVRFAFGGGFDIDRLAVELNLTFEQMAKLEPILKKYQKDVKDLYAEMRELGGFGDPEAWKAFKEELDALLEETEPELAKVLDEKQVEKMKKRLRRGGFGPAVIGGGHVQVLRSGDGAVVIQVKKPEKP